jgi:predicted alpha-1,2-mannosidase
VDGHYLDQTGPEAVVRRVPLDERGKPTFRMYNFDAKWGSHWSLNVLWPLLCPERYNEFCQTMVQMYRDGGLIPRGPSGGNYTFVMIGDSAAPFITSAYAKGIRDFDCEAALEGLVRNTRADGGRYYGGYATRPSERTHRAYTTKGYVAKGEGLRGSHGSSVSSFTLYNSYHDWCIAHMARGLGREEIYQSFIRGAGNYRHVIWPEKRCAWVRLRDGSWEEGFRRTAKGFTQPGFCETSAAISTFYVPHDPRGLAARLGGEAAAAEQLNAQFEAAAAHDFYFKGRDHGRALVDYANQDSTGMAHYFNRIGYPALTQKWARAVLDRAFSGVTPTSGYNGDEDQGQMGSLSALLALGLFQFDGGSGPAPRYDLTAPVFEKITLHLSERYFGGHTATIVCEDHAEDHAYIRTASWNDTPLATPMLPHADLVGGGVLRLKLGAEPAAATE